MTPLFRFYRITVSTPGSDPGNLGSTPNRTVRSDGVMAACRSSKPLVWVRAPVGVSTFKKSFFCSSGVKWIAYRSRGMVIRVRGSVRTFLFINYSFFLKKSKIEKLIISNMLLLVQ